MEGVSKNVFNVPSTPVANCEDGLVRFQKTKNLVLTRLGLHVTHHVLCELIACMPHFGHISHQRENTKPPAEYQRNVRNQDQNPERGHGAIQFHHLNHDRSDLHQMEMQR